tara:strand:+ start:2243 stop:2842 length:600 start_codon:yes stop_codon:yes gene_type:complete
MRKKEFLAFYKNKYEGVNIGGGDWKFTVESNGAGYLNIVPRLLKTPPIQYLEPGVYISPFWYVELVLKLLGDKHPNWLISMGAERRLKPEGGEVFEEHLEENLEVIKRWFYKNNKPEIYIAELARIYALGNEGVGPAYRMKFYIACVFKGEVELLETERKAKEDGTSKRPPAFTLEFFENCVRIAKEYQTGKRTPPVDF